MPAAAPLEQRFWAKVDKDGPTMPGMDSQCWIWTACSVEVSRGFRYGQIGIGGRVCFAHRAAYWLHTGVYPAHFDIDHICHNTLCVRYAHLRLATRSQNNQNHRGAYRRSKSGIRGVYWQSQISKWYVRVAHNGKDHYVGVFNSIEDAEAAAIKTRCELHSHNDWDRRAEEGAAVR